MKLPSLGPRGEGWVALQVACMAAIVLGAFLFPGFAPGGDRGDVRLLGDVVIVGGVAVLAWATAVLRPANAFSALPHPRADGALVDSGPYRYVRHPIYSGLILAGVGALISRKSVAAGLATIVLAIVLDLKRRREEVWLLERYPGYAAYRTRTKALIPFVY